MSLKNCANCNGLFVSAAGDLCPACLDADERAVVTVEKFLRTAPNASMEEVSRGTGVDSAILMRLVRSRKLKLANEDHLVCEACGIGIRSGRLCMPCQGKLTEIMAGEEVKRSAPRLEESESRRAGRSSIILDKFQRK